MRSLRQAYAYDARGPPASSTLNNYTVTNRSYRGDTSVRGQGEGVNRQSRTEVVRSSITVAQAVARGIRVTTAIRSGERVAGESRDGTGKSTSEKREVRGSRTETAPDRGAEDSGKLAGEGAGTKQEDPKSEPENVRRGGTGSGNSAGPAIGGRIVIKRSDASNSLNTRDYDRAASAITGPEKARAPPQYPYFS